MRLIDSPQAQLYFFLSTEQGVCDKHPLAAYGLGVILARQARREDEPVLLEQAARTADADTAPPASYDLGTLLAGRPGRRAGAIASSRSGLELQQKSHPKGGTHGRAQR